MPKRTFSLRPGEPPSIELAWRGIWKQITVTQDGRTLGTIPDQKALKQGAAFQLLDGSNLEVKLVTGLTTELQVMRNGLPLPGSGSDPAQRLALARGMVWVIAGLSTALGLIAELGNVEFLRVNDIGWASVAVGAIFGVLGWLVGRRSQIALGIAVGLFALDTVLTLMAMTQAGRVPNVGPIVVRFFLFVPMVRGFGAIKALKAADQVKKATDVF